MHNLPILHIPFVPIRLPGMCSSRRVLPRIQGSHALRNNPHILIEYAGFCIYHASGCVMIARA